MEEYENGFYKAVDFILSILIIPAFVVAMFLATLVKCVDATIDYVQENKNYRKKMREYRKEQRNGK